MVEEVFLLIKNTQHKCDHCKSTVPPAFKKNKLYRRPRSCTQWSTILRFKYLLNYCQGAEYEYFNTATEKL